MIHAVCMPSDDLQISLLKEIMALQHAMLQFAAERSEIIEKGNASALTDFLAKDHYAGNKTKSELAIKWLTRKPTLLEQFNLFAVHDDIAAKTPLVTNIKYDVELLFLSQPLDGIFQVKIGNQDPVWKRGAGSFCYKFYDTWKDTGFKHELLREPFREPSVVANPYTRAIFVEKFVENNANLYMCPICDATPYRSETGKGIYTSVDHFFPRSRYPHLSIHPYNLLPICPACNSGVAGQSDPLADIGSLKKLALPYRGLGLSKLIFTAIEFKTDVERTAQNQSNPLKLKFRPAATLPDEYNQKDVQALIESLEKVYRVQERWNSDNNLTLIDEHVFRRIRQFLLLDIRYGASFATPAEVAERLEILMALVDRDGVGRDVFAFITVWWLHFHIGLLKKSSKELAERRDTQTEPIENHGFNALFAELSDWAENEQLVFEQLKEHLAEIEARFPKTTAIETVTDH